MVMSMRALVVMIALFWMAAGFGPKAYAFGKHSPNTARALRRQKKNASPYAYLAPQKHKKSSSYRSPVTGNLLYGTKKK